MILYTYSTAADGTILEEHKAEVKDREAATAEIAFDLSSTASDMFTHNALTQWITTGKVDKLAEDSKGEFFWNAELLDS